MSTSYAGHADDHDHHGPDPGLLRWVFTTNHKDIGTLYLWFALIMFFVGGFLAMGIRAELFMPGLQVMDPHLFNQFTTMHALIMIFGAIMPAFVGFANWLVPMMVGGAGHGAAASEQLELLDPSVRVHPPHRHLLPAGRARRPRAGPSIRRWCCRAGRTSLSWSSRFISWGSRPSWARSTSS